MKSHLTKTFRTCFRQLPERIQRLARKSYTLWKTNPSHPSLEFKRVGNKTPVYSVRVSIGYRALGVKKGDMLIWFWIGSHPEYERLLQKF
jgi:hypothetical protein